eukprot:700748-Amphidinium_carterae.1
MAAYEPAETRSSVSPGWRERELFDSFIHHPVKCREAFSPKQRQTGKVSGQAISPRCSHHEEASPDRGEPTPDAPPPEEVQLPLCRVKDRNSQAGCKPSRARFARALPRQSLQRGSS